VEKAAAQTVTITLNGKPMAVAVGSTVIQAVHASGGMIPHYCYHEDLSIAGVCRMCMVEIEKVPRLQIACNTPVAEGMVVRTDTDKVKAAVKSTLELHLINHPLDCPICDKAGECKLQDYYSDYGLYQSRMEYEKVHKPKVQDIGTIVLDSERCILCTRCVRFTEEVSQSHELGIFQRGDRSELRTYDHGPLRNDYTGNLADICPVGALTAKDFRFQCRVWFLEETKSVCGQCARGCNTVVSVNPSVQKLYRVEPRRNADVNKSWICDQGRWDYHYVSSEDRIKTPAVREGEGFQEVPWAHVFKKMHASLKSDSSVWACALSTQLTNEELVDVVECLKGFGVKQFIRLADAAHVADRTAYDGVLKHRDQTPNALGWEKLMNAMGVSFIDIAQWSPMAQIMQNLLIVGAEGHVMPGLSQLLKATPASVALYFHGTNWNAEIRQRALAVLPNVSVYEKSGTFVNALGRLQKTKAAIPAQHISRNAHSLSLGLQSGDDRQLVSSKKQFELFEGKVRVMLKTEASWKLFPLEGVSL